ncbi:MAG: YfhO family protein, partial [Clostridia bacterium]|nr:YfhO family protein [Clostridia bacterium]
LYPFGNNSVLSYDLNAQYVHFFLGLKNLLASGEGVLYTWTRTLGGEYMGIIAYYLISPFNLPVFILPASMIETALLITILGKSGAIGASAYAYFHRGGYVRHMGALIFSTAYALCAYSVVYGSNLMWLDALFILPLLLWGIERLVRKQGNGLYVFSLAYAMITNYYMGFMLCILTALYFFVFRFGRYADEMINATDTENTFIRSLARIAVYSVIAIAISAFVLLPAYHSLSFGKTDFTVGNFNPQQTADFLAIFKKLLFGSYDSVGNAGLPFIYTGLLPLLLAPAFFIAQKIGAREKIASALLVAFLIASLSLSTLDIVWHGFQFPNCLNHRYSFILSFFLCSLAARAYGAKDTYPRKTLYASFAALAILIMCAQAQHYSFGDDFICIWVSLGILAVYLATVCFFGTKKLTGYLSSALLAIVCIEMFAASAVSLVYYDIDVVYSKHGNTEANTEKYAPVVEAIYKADPDFYRVERVGKRLLNDPLSLNMRGISGSTSTLNASVLELMDKMGYGGRSNFANYFSSAVASDTLMGIRYLISDQEIDDGIYTVNEALTSLCPEGVYVYENPYALSVMYTVKDTAISEDSEKYLTPFESVNALFSRLTDADTMPYTAIKLKGVNYGNIYPLSRDGHLFMRPGSAATGDGYHRVSFKVPTQEGKPVYACFPSDYSSETSLYVNGEFLAELKSNEGTSAYLLGTFHGEEITVEVRWKNKEFSVRNGISYFYQLEPEALSRACSTLADGQIKVSQFTNTSIKGSFNYSPELSVLYSTVPYDEDWTVKIDGKTVTPIRVSEALLGVDLAALGISEGEHTVEISFSSRSFNTGVVISLLGAVALIGIGVTQRYDLVKIIFKRRGKSSENK